MSRTRKAWCIEFRHRQADPFIAYQPTASKARAEAIARLRDVWDCSWKQALAEIWSCRRAPERDVELPDRHPLALQLSDGVLHCVVHAFGGKGLKAGYRDHFYANADDWEMQAALFHCLFRVYRRDKGHSGYPDMVMYELTDLGRNVARGEAETYLRF